MNSLAYANKCRECAKTLDAGLAAWCGPRTHAACPCHAGLSPVPARAPLRFNRDGEPGRKTTCVQCHDAKGPAIAPEEEDPNVATQKKASKKRKAVAKARPATSHVAVRSVAPAEPTVEPAEPLRVPAWRR